MKLSEYLWFEKHSLQLKGFVNLDQFTPESLKDVPADHALVFLFQAFQGQYFQTISAHLSKGAANGQCLAKLILEAVCLLEDAGFFVDAVVTDAASWNRKAWTEFGLTKKMHERQNSTQKYTIDDEEEEEDIDDSGLLAFATAQNKTKSKPKKKNVKRKTKTNVKKVPPLSAIDESNSGASCVHPCDDERRLWFVSDFPHLVKSVKQRVINAEVLEVRPTI